MGMWMRLKEMVFFYIVCGLVVGLVMGMGGNGWMVYGWFLGCFMGGFMDDELYYWMVWFL